MTVTSIGYGDIAPTTTSEQLVAVVIMLLGSVLWGQVIATFCGVVATFNPEAADYRRTSAHARSTHTPPRGLGRARTLASPHPPATPRSPATPRLSDPSPAIPRLSDPSPCAVTYAATVCAVDDLNRFMSVHGLATEMRRRLREYFHRARRRRRRSCVVYPPQSTQPHTSGSHCRHGATHRSDEAPDVRRVRARWQRPNTCG
jgi:hypothetical protein